MSRFNLQSTLFKLLLLIVFGLLAWQSTLHFAKFDWSKNQRNSLTSDSIRLISSFDEAIKFTLFASPLNENLALLNDLLKRYQYHQPLIEIDIVDPDLSPDLIREYDIRVDGALIIEFQNKVEKIEALSERQITNAIQRLKRQGDRWIVFLEGHGERHPYGDANHDISSFSAQLAHKGFNIESINLTTQAEFPDNTHVLVLASPQITLLPGERDLVIDYIHRGGNLLWLAEPDQSDELDQFAELLNFEFMSGIIVDQNSQLLGLDRVDYALVNEYPIHPITEFIDSIALFPQATALFYDIDNQTHSDWTIASFLSTQANTWTETGDLSGEIVAGDHSDEVIGPLNLGLTFERDIDLNDRLKKQRIVVIGDGDFLSNQFLGNGANAEIGFNLMNWLSLDDHLIAINAKSAPDTTLELSETEKLILAFSFLIIMPLIFLGTGIRIWYVRKNS